MFSHLYSMARCFQSSRDTSTRSWRRTPAACRLGVESLEKRRVMSASPVAAVHTSHPAHVQAAAISDRAVNTESAAHYPVALQSPTTAHDTVRTDDTHTYYKFSLSSPRAITLTLSSVAAGLDLELRNSGGAVLGASTKTTAGSESMTKTLDAGTYYVRITEHCGSTNYTLTLS